jgi:undecaprenyl diphosphate synthase
MSDIPRHIAIIMDGNGRWAENRGLPKLAGHRQGVESLIKVVEYCRKKGIQVLTVYAFSTENWKRPKSEVDALMGFVGKYLDREMGNLMNNNIRINFIGRLDELAPSVKKRIDKAILDTKHNDKLIFNIALNYGARNEIVDAVNRIIEEGLRAVDGKMFEKFLYTSGLPDPDLIIRTSGEMRISNFLLWQASYSELYFTEKLWPDFGKEDMEEAIEAYKKRDRRFGGRTR